MQKAFFIVLEGIDGSGTTTHTKLLGEFLKKKGFKVHLTREPSSSMIGKLLKEALLDDTIPPETDALLFAADRTLHYKMEIKKKLDESFIVISDRYLESSIVYQSSQSNDVSVDWIEDINKFVGYPDITIILDLPPEISLERKRAHLETTGENSEKFETIEFLKRVRKKFLNRAKKKNYIVINSEEKIDRVQEEIQNYVKKI